MRGDRTGAKGPTSLKPESTRTVRASRRQVAGEKVTRLTPGDLHPRREASPAGKCGEA